MVVCISRCTANGHRRIAVINIISRGGICNVLRNRVIYIVKSKEKTTSLKSLYIKRRSRARELDKAQKMFVTATTTIAHQPVVLEGMEKFAFFFSFCGFDFAGFYRIYLITWNVLQVIRIK